MSFLSSATFKRLIAGCFVIILIVLAVLARRHGFDGPTLQRELQDLGILAAPAFLLAFAIGELLHLPGILFVVAARVVFGPTVGFFLGYAGALLALTISFAVARRLVSAARATRDPWRPRFRPLRVAFEKLEARPVRSVALLRLVLWLAPPLTYALATTRLRTRDHLLGCAVGLVVPVLAADFIGGLL